MDMELAGRLIEQYGYLAVFFSTVIEGEAVVLAAALLSTGGLLQAHWVIAAAALGAFVGHIMFFAIGRWKGMQLIEALPFLRRHYPKANLVMDRYANWSVFVFQYLYGTRLISAILFGCSTISFPRFLLLQLINCITWSVLAFFAGHVIGMIAYKLFEMVGLYGLMLIVTLLAMLILLLYHRYGHHHVKGFLSGGRDVAAEQADAVQGRHFALEQLEYHIQLAARAAVPLSLLLLRLPGNGHGESGERLDVRLSLLARELCRLLRLSDIPARFGRDTFAVLVPHTDAVGARRAVARLLAELAPDRAGMQGDGDAAALWVGMAEWRAGMTSGQMLDHAYGSMQQVRSPADRTCVQGFDVEAKAQ